MLATDKHDSTLGILSEAFVTIYLGKGDHFLFACFGDKIDADMAVINHNGAETVTDFCAEIDSLRAVYTISDNIKLTFKPMDCTLSNDIDAADLDVYNDYCVDFT